jgi:hypothetical protein
MDMDTLAPTCIAAFVDERGELDHVRRAGMDLAGKHGARLLLYDSTSGSAFTEPVASELSAEGESEKFGPLLSDVDLETLGRQEVARHVREAREGGIDAWGRLASQHGVEPFLEFAASQGADLVLLPEELEDPTIVDRLRGETVDEAEDKSSVPIALVDRRGRLR